TLAERRPVTDFETMRGMLERADVIVTARVSLDERGEGSPASPRSRAADDASGEGDSLLVGVWRAITDFNYCTYLSDLAVDEAYQRRGIGRELIRRTHEAAGFKTTLILLAAPKAQAYYPHIGMTRHESCWVIPRQ